MNLGGATECLWEKKNIIGTFQKGKSMKLSVIEKGMGNQTMCYWKESEDIDFSYKKKKTSFLQQENWHNIQIFWLLTKFTELPFVLYRKLLFLFVSRHS